jgi:nucleoside triphosphate pyrophosphatase
VPARSLFLASASPARLGLLRSAGFDPVVMVSGDAEDGVDGLGAADVAGALAARKAAAVTRRMAPLVADGPVLIDGTKVDGTTLVVGCDSVLAFAGEVRGKPRGSDQAAAWWRGYRGRSGTLVTGHALVEIGTGWRARRVAQTTVRFGDPTDAEIEALVASGEPLAVAGGFTIDGRCGPFVAGIDGDHGAVLGLSLPTFRALLGDLGVSVTDLWSGP